MTHSTPESTYYVGRKYVNAGPGTVGEGTARGEARGPRATVSEVWSFRWRIAGGP